MQNSQEYFRNLNFIFFWLFAPQLIFLCIVVWILDLDRDDDYDFHYMIADFVFVVVCLGLSFCIPRKKMKLAKQKLGLGEKLAIYKRAMVIKWTLILLTSLFSIVAFIMTKENIFICTTIFSLVVYLLKKPSIKVTCEQLNLSDREERILRNPKSVI